MPTVTLVLCLLLQPGGKRRALSRTPALLKAVTLGVLLNLLGTAVRLRPCFPYFSGWPRQQSPCGMLVTVVRLVHLTEVERLQTSAVMTVACGAPVWHYSASMGLMAVHHSRNSGLTLSEALCSSSAQLLFACGCSRKRTESI